MARPRALSFDIERDAYTSSASGADSPPLIENIPIPAHLLATAPVQEHWTPDPARRRTESLAQQNAFDPIQIAREQRHEIQQRLTRSHSISVGGLARSRVNGRDTVHANNLAIAGPPLRLRKTSLPAVGEDRVVSQHAALESIEDLEPLSSSLLSTRRNSFDTIGQSSNPFADSNAVADDAIVFNRLHNYNISSTNTTRASMDSQIDPFSNPMYIIPVQTSVDEAVTGERNKRFSVISARRPSLAPSLVRTVTNKTINVIDKATNKLTDAAKKTELHTLYEKAKVRGEYLQRKKWVQLLFEYTIYVLILMFIYFVLVGRPLWKGAVWWLYWVVETKFVVAGTWSITIGLAVIYAYVPLLLKFEDEPPMPTPTEKSDATMTPGVHNTALLIPCYKSANIIGPTLQAALKVFPANHIYVISNGNSPTPLDNTEEVCRPFGVNHIWSPIGSKIVAQFVGCYAAKKFENVLLIDDDCALPANFPIVSDRMKGKVKCIGYTIKSVGPNSSVGTLCQQAQDLEYKISGLQRAVAGIMGSATFPHGAISLWNTEFLIKTFHTHPGFSVSEDWFFGHVARQLGCRIKMCTAIFVETETPSAIFFSSGGARGGFGEMTVFKQRFYRWNFFFVNGMYYNMKYILFSWKLGWWELGAKLFVFQEVYETLLYLLAPFVLPISLIVRPAFCAYLLAATFVLYLLNVVVFNEIHLRLRNERVGWKATYLYYAPYKIILTAVNIFSCYFALYKYARYFAKRHPKVVEDEKAVEIVLRLEETATLERKESERTIGGGRGRKYTITAVGSRLSRMPTNATARSARYAVSEDEGELPQATEAIDFAS